MTTKILLWCAIASADVIPSDIIDCFDTLKECQKEYGSILECARCEEDKNKTECLGYGATYDKNI